MAQVWSILTILAAIAALLIFRARCRASSSDKPLVRSAHGLFLISIALLALSSLFVRAFGISMHGWMLLLHMTAAPLFAIAIAVLALLWAQRTSMCVRLILLSGFFAILSAMFMMMSWFGTDWQRWLLNAHRISSMVLVIAVAAQAGRTVLGKPAGTSDVARTGD